MEDGIILDVTVLTLNDVADYATMKNAATIYHAWHITDPPVAVIESTPITPVVTSTLNDALTITIRSRISSSGQATDSLYIKFPEEAMYPLYATNLLADAADVSYPGWAIFLDTTTTGPSTSIPMPVFNSILVTGVDPSAITALAIVMEAAWVPYTPKNR
jgi:hypothetical protein